MNVAQQQPAADLRGYRRALSAFATGVAVVTARSASGPLGLTINSFASVSLQPPLILWSIGERSADPEAFCTAERFAIHVLGAGQRAECERFARSGSDRFADARWEPDADGVPRLAGCIARFQCRRHAVYPGGDHRIIVGEVLGFETATGAPLMFVLGQYLDAAGRPTP
jgi:flavin reductase (DIM6/NTAB) family NADH-FMN oxidoreductase RutF